MYRDLESLCCITGNNIILQVVILQKQTNSQKDKICGYQRQDLARGNWMKVVKSYKPPVMK